MEMDQRERLAKQNSAPLTISKSQTPCFETDTEVLKWLTASFELKGWELPNPAVTEIWLEVLKSFPPDVIRPAFMAYIADGVDQNGQPERLEPAAIKWRCDRILRDRYSRREQELEDARRRDREEHPEKYCTLQEFNDFMQELAERCRRKFGASTRKEGQ
jgi:hypothetical protein